MPALKVRRQRKSLIFVCIDGGGPPHTIWQCILFDLTIVSDAAVSLWERRLPYNEEIPNNNIFPICFLFVLRLIFR